jgi:hypothetical protein
MTRDWRPGDVFVARIDEPPYSAADVREFMDELIEWWPRRPRPDESGVGKAGGSSMFRWFTRLVEAAQVGPLVVIDPEDREQVERLICAQDVHFDGTPRHSVTADDLADMMQAALRSLIEPPRPDEPTGLGAVVEDERGEWWIRDKTTTTVNHWKRARGEDGGSRYSWSHIRPVRIVHEGVTA